MPTNKAAVIGTGYIGAAHIEALARIGVQIKAVADTNIGNAEVIAGRYNIKGTYQDYREMLENEDINSVHICTPNNMHYEIAMAVVEKKLNVLCEKPLSLTAEQSAALCKEAKRNSVLGAVNFNYRYYPAVQHARGLIKTNGIGKINIVIGNYLQDWLLYDTDYNWRLDPKVGGKSRAIADIGSHWCDLAQHVSGLKITDVMADLLTVHKERKQAKGEMLTFKKADADAEYTQIPMTTEDYGGVLVRFENGARGMFCASQVSAGQKCRIRLELYGSDSSLSWDHGDANSLWIGKRDGNCETVTKSPVDMNEQGAAMAHYPAGHPEGYPSVIKNMCLDFYNCITRGKESGTLPTFEDGYCQNRIVEAILESSRRSCWVRVEN